jgi:hypothetical protein
MADEQRTSDDQRVIELSEQGLQRAWELTCAFAANEGTSKRSLDQLFIAAARFAERVDSGFLGEGVLLDSGKATPTGKLTYMVRRRAG